MSALLEFDNITRSFHGVRVLRGITLEVPAAAVTGLVGGNGAGKSTLMNLAGGILQPDGGAMRWQGQAYAPRHVSEAAATGIAFVHQELNLFPNLTLAENLLLTSFPTAGPFINRKELDRVAQILLDRVGITHRPDMLLERLAPGERQLVEIAKALRGKPRLIILDEPTTSLSPPECSRLFVLMRKLTTDGCAFIFISHSLSDVLGICDFAAVLRDGLVADSGSVGEFSQGRFLTGMSGRAAQQIFPQRSVEAIHSKRLLEVKELSQPGIVKDISFGIGCGEILGLAGLMGAGRTELARIIFGLDPHCGGEIFLDGARLRGGPRRRIAEGMGFITESRGDDGILAEASVRENVVLTTLPRHARGPARLISKRSVKEEVDRVLEAVHLQPAMNGLGAIQRLSGGNQQKAVIARWLLLRPKVLILDEPTRGIDAAAKFEIYQLILELAAQGTALLLISSEQEELLALSDRILVLSRGRVSAEFSRPEFDHGKLLEAAFLHHSADGKVSP